MANISGDKSVEIDAPIDKVYAIAADLDHAPEWQGSLRSVDVLERDGQGRALVVDCVNDAKVREVTSRLRFDYAGEPHTMRWVQEKGDTKSLNGEWRLEELGPDRTRATYALDVDPGRVLGMLMRGPVVDRVRSALLGDAAEGLKRRAETGA